MANVTICDVCGKELTKPFLKFRVLKAELNQESRDMRTVGNVDLHETCYKLMQDWMTENKRKELAK